MSYHIVGDRGEALGFSLKPPKWLRKLQPGKILAKVALPAAAIAAAVFIPGVGGALVKGASLLLGGGKAVGGAVISAVTPSANPNNTVGIPQISIPAQVPMPATVPTPISMTPPAGMPLIPPAAGASASRPSGAGVGPMMTQSSMALPAVIALGAVLLLTSRRRG